VISFLTHLNGALAATLLCALLFVDEVGVPLPFAPNEVLLLLGGLLMATGVLEPFLFVQLALLTMTAGMLTGPGQSRQPKESIRRRWPCYFARRLATTLIIVATTTTPNRYDSTAWRRAGLRMCLDLMSVSET
jgi:membrane protein DedA with SNARE-associated domain